MQLPATSAGYPPELWQQGGRVRRVALCDWLARRLAALANTATADARTQAAGWHGAKGGDVLVDRPGRHLANMIADQCTNMQCAYMTLVGGMLLEPIPLNQWLSDAIVRVCSCEVSYVAFSCHHLGWALGHLMPT